MEDEWRDLAEYTQFHNLGYRVAQIDCSNEESLVCRGYRMHKVPTMAMFYKSGPIHRAYGYDPWGAEQRLSLYPNNRPRTMEEFNRWALDSVVAMKAFEKSKELSKEL